MGAIEEVLPSAHESKMAIFPQRHRPKYTRTRAGCLKCRVRRKKCDEEKPVCKACRRNKLECCWPEQSVADSSTDDTSTESSSLSPASSDFTPKLFESFRITIDSTIHSPCSAWTHCETLLQTRWSPYLFTHYVERTSGIMCTRSDAKDVFGRQIVEMALRDDLMLHALLALSGAHLNYNDEASFEIRQGISVHYRAAIEGIRNEVDHLMTSLQSSKPRLALVLLLMCHVEVIDSSGSRSGDIHPHLRAVRQLLLGIQQSPGGLAAEKDQFTLGIVLETYAYLALVSNIIPYGLLKGRLIEFDSFVTQLDYLQQYETFGTFFSCGYDIFECIAPVSLLSRQCIDDISTHGCVSDRTWCLYSLVKSRVESLNIHNVTQGPLPEGAEQIYEVYRCALLMFLETAPYSIGVSSGKAREVVQPHLDRFFELLNEATETKYKTVSVWPLMITASCCTTETQKEAFRARCHPPAGKWRVNQTVTAIFVLELLWASKDELAYGPYGLYLTMKKHKISISMA